MLISVEAVQGYLHAWRVGDPVERMAGASLRAPAGCSRTTACSPARSAGRASSLARIHDVACPVGPVPGQRCPHAGGTAGHRTLFRYRRGVDEHLPPAVVSAADELVADFQRNWRRARGWRTGSWPAGRWCTPPGTASAGWAAQPPDAGTVFRIASMTKSFTAAGSARAARRRRSSGWMTRSPTWSPSCADAPKVSAAFCPDITVRHLLTMTAGFPTDDPWGDRQQGLPLGRLRHPAAPRGVRQAWAPGTCFEYSNLGYALLGRVVAAAAGAATRSSWPEPAAPPAGPGPDRV